MCLIMSIYSSRVQGSSKVRTVGDRPVDTILSSHVQVPSHHQQHNETAGADSVNSGDFPLIIY